MIDHYDPFLDERIMETTLANGLPIKIVPKPGFSKKYAYFVTRYGSIDTKFRWNGREFTTPDGVAHYLEHKMFDLPDRDVMQEFSALGANPNAFTNFFMTAYYFSCTEHFLQCLRLLLTYVSTPYFTQESVEKERGIIEQEIRMCEDRSDIKVEEDLFAALFRHHPARVPIAGTVESIGKITAQTLLDCYRAFYTPSNMILCVVGDVDPEEVVRTAEEILPPERQPAAERDYGPPEDLRCYKNRMERRMDVAMPTFQMGVQCPWPGRGPAGMRQQIVGDLAAEALMGESSALYLQLYEQGLIDASFGAGYEDLPGVALLSCGGDSRDPQAVQAAILAEAERLGREGIEEDMFQRLKKSALGRRVRGLDSFDGTCYRLCASYFDGVRYLDFPEVYASVTKEQTEEFLRQTMQADRCAMSVVWPRQWEE